MALKKDGRHLGAKRMWICRWTHAKKISKAEAKRFLKHLEKTGKCTQANQDHAVGEAGSHLSFNSGC